MRDCPLLDSASSSSPSENIAHMLAQLCLHRYKIDACSLEILIKRRLSRSESLLLASFQFFYSDIALDYFLKYEEGENFEGIRQDILFRSICEFIYEHYKGKGRYVDEYFSQTRSMMNLVIRMRDSYERIMSLDNPVTNANIMNVQATVLVMWITEVFYEQLKIMDLPAEVFTSWRKIVLLNMERALRFWGEYFSFPNATVTTESKEAVGSA